MYMQLLAHLSDNWFSNAKSDNWFSKAKSAPHCFAQQILYCIQLFLSFLIPHLIKPTNETRQNNFSHFFSVLSIQMDTYLPNTMKRTKKSIHCISYFTHLQKYRAHVLKTLNPLSISYLHALKFHLIVIHSNEKRKEN